MSKQETLKLNYNWDLADIGEMLSYVVSCQEVGHSLVSISIDDAEDLLAMAYEYQKTVQDDVVFNTLSDFHKCLDFCKGVDQRMCCEAKLAESVLEAAYAWKENSNDYHSC